MATCCEQDYSIPDCMLPHRVNIESCTLVKSSMGPDQRKYPPQGGTVKKADVHCLVEPLTSDKIVRFMEQGYRVSHRLYFSADPAMETTDRIVYGTRYFDSGKAIDVAEQGAVFTLDCQEVTF